MKGSTHVVVTSKSTSNLGARLLDEDEGNHNDRQNNLDVREEGLHW